MARKTINVDYLARVEGEGGVTITFDGPHGARRRTAHLRAAALLRGVPARPRLYRGARHHRAHLRHLPGRLPDERGARDGGRARRHGERAGARAAPAAVLRRVDREPHAAHLHAARARLSRLPGRDRDGEGPWRHRAPGSGAEEGRQRDPGTARRTRDPSGERAGRRLLPRAVAPRAAHAGRAVAARARHRAVGGALGVRLRFPRLRARLRVRLAWRGGRVPVQRRPRGVEQGPGHHATASTTRISRNRM